MADGFEVFADRFLSSATQYCADFAASESDDLASTTTQFSKIATEMAPLDMTSSADRRVLVLRETSSIQYHAAPVTSNLNEAGVGALAIINKMRADAGGTESNTWWLTFFPVAGPQGKEWKFERAELQVEGGTREVEENTEWITTVMQKYLNRAAQESAPATARSNKTPAPAAPAGKTGSAAQQPASGGGAGSVSNTIGLAEQGSAFTVRTPQAICCNCGNKSGLSSIPTSFIKNLKFSTRFETEFSFDLELPYCDPCSTLIEAHPANTIASPSSANSPP